MSDVAKRKVLGRGLSALIPAANTPVNAEVKRHATVIAIERIQPNPDQPRSHFDADKLEELAQSIRENGIIQPILVRKVDDHYQIIAGERRWRAAQKAGLHEVPVVQNDLDDRDVLAVALIENIQRADLNPIEEAQAYQRLLDDYQYTQESLAKRVGKERSTVANSLRLLKLPEKVRDWVVSGQLTMGHARALLGLDDVKQMESAGYKLVQTQASVREAERLVQKLREGTSAKPTPVLSLEARALVDKLQSALSTRVRIRENGGKGTVELDFHSLQELDRLVDHMLSHR